MDYFRATLITSVIVGFLSTLIQTLVYDSVLVLVGAILWSMYGQVRVYGPVIGAPTYALALKGAVMSLAWPLVPKRR